MKRKKGKKKKRGWLISFACLRGVTGAAFGGKKDEKIRKNTYLELIQFPRCKEEKEKRGSS